MIIFAPIMNFTPEEDKRAIAFLAKLKAKKTHVGLLIFEDEGANLNALRAEYSALSEAVELAEEIWDLKFDKEQTEWEEKGKFTPVVFKFTATKNRLGDLNIIGTTAFDVHLKQVEA